MRNIRLVISYDGTDFSGWQVQPNVPTIQGTIAEAIRILTGEKVNLCGSGRTDAGVHALNQVANFETNSDIPCKNLVKALNNLLPPTIRVKNASQVPLSFHARHAARSKTYRYRILQTPVCSPFLARFVCHYPYFLDYTRMAEAAKYFAGQHNFASFAGSGGLIVRQGRGEPHKEHVHKNSALAGNSGMVRTIFTSRVLWRPRSSMLIYEVQGSGFLHHMVRNMVGTLIEVGRGRLEPWDVPKIMTACDRALAGPTAPASGLFLVKVEY
jgi:tRNA pseudouridine38-40 synthase